MRSVAAIERALRGMLRKSLPARLREEVGVRDAKGWVREHLEAYTEEQAQFPDLVLLPWTNMIAYDDWVEDAFFVILILHEGAVELFCGTGPWPAVRKFGEGKAEDVPASKLHREWASRFTVPCPPLVLDRAEVKKWLGREW